VNNRLFSGMASVNRLTLEMPGHGREKIYPLKQPPPLQEQATASFGRSAHACRWFTALKEGLAVVVA
jgi:hypothetical protein